MPPEPPPADALTRAPHRIVLVHPGALGDFVQAFPAFGAVRAAFPTARIAVLTDTGLAGLARGTGLFDDVLAFDASVAFGGGMGARVALTAGLARALRRFGPHAVGVFKGSPVYAALAAASGAARRAGLCRGFGGTLLTHPVPIDPTRHHEDRFLDVAAALGADPARRTDARWPTAIAPIPPSAPERFLIGLAPGGGRNAKQDTPTKRWPADRFAELTRELARDYPQADFVLLGAASDRAELDVVRAALPRPDAAIDLGGRTDVTAARAAIAALDVYVGNDSGLMHVAATTGTPAVIVFGPTDPRAIAPRRAGLHVVWDPVDDPPCYSEVTGAQRACASSCCIERVRVDRVRAAVEHALACRRACEDVEY